MSKIEEEQQKFFTTRLMKIANSLSQTGKNSRANMIRFDIPQTYNVLKFKEWLILKKENNTSHRNWYKLEESPKLGFDAEKELTKMLTEEINKEVLKASQEKEVIHKSITLKELSNIVREETQKMLGEKNLFKAQPNGKR